VDLPAASDLVGILSVLTRSHKRYLTQIKYAERLNAKPKPKNLEQRLVKLATVLGPTGVAPYRNAYLHRPSRFAALFTPNDDRLTADAIAKIIQSKYHDAVGPIEPTLTEAGPPEFNSLQTLPDGSLSLDFVSLGNPRTVQDGYTFKTERPIHHDIVMIGASRPSIEISSRTDAQRDNILGALLRLLKKKPDAFQLHAFDRPSDWKKLQKKLAADIFKDDGNRDGKKEPAAYSMSARRGERLDDLPKWQALELKHEEARELGLFFTCYSHIDGYPEQVYYYIRTASGDLKFLDDVSESARNLVLDEYLKIA
jgi:hypothetical protein